MVDVGAKLLRRPGPGENIYAGRDTAKNKRGGLTKGDVLGVAQVAGNGRYNPFLIPMCHPLFITGVDLDFQFVDEKLSCD